MKKRKFTAVILALFLLSVLTGCSQASAAAADNLMFDIESVEVAGKAPDSDFVNSQISFGVELLKECYRQGGSGENILVSPLSAVYALAMTANGAKGKTLEEMEALLGGGMTVDQLNEYLNYYLNSLSTVNDEQENGFKLHMANSLWFKDDDENLTVEKDFLQTNASYYHAEIYKAPFDNSTVKEVNDWVSKNTDNMIPQIINEFKPNDIMCLINALAFDAEWSNTYEKYRVHDGTFTDEKGKETTVDMMFSKEDVYLRDENASGFLKSYKGGKFSLGALLPDEDISINDYIGSLSAEGLLKTLTENREQCRVEVNLPKFKCEYDVDLKQHLINMGMPTAFDLNAADFSKLGKSRNNNIGIDLVIHKTFIQVDEKGTKAGASTLVVPKDGASSQQQYKEVTLDRPFLYMIVDNDTGLPIFLGVVNSID